MNKVFLLRYMKAELRAAFKSALPMIISLSLGVMAIVSVLSLTAMVETSLKSEVKVVLGGDALFSTVSSEISKEQREIIKGFGEISETKALRAMVRSEAAAMVRSEAAAMVRSEAAAMVRSETATISLVELKAVDSAFPLYGTMKTSPQAPLAELLANGGALAEKSFFVKMNAKIGDSFTLGSTKIVLKGEILVEPDKLSAGLTLGARLMVSNETLLKANLVQEGSLYRSLVKLKTPLEVKDVASRVKAETTLGQLEFRQSTNPSPAIERNITRFTEFLFLAGLTALLIGALGIYHATSRLVEKKRNDIATLKALGASENTLYSLFSLQLALLAGIGILMGVAVGVILPFWAVNAFQSLLPFPLEAVFAWKPVLLGFFYGVMIVMLSALLPLEKVKVISVASLYREGFEARRIQPKTLVIFSLFLIAFFLSLLFSASNKLIVTAFFGALIVIIAFIFLLIKLVSFLASRINSNNLTAKFIIKGLRSTPSPSKSLLLTLSLGLSLMTALFFVEDTIRDQIDDTRTGDTPSFFFVDIPNREDAAFEALVKNRKGDVVFNKVASLRGRLTHLNGVEAANTKVKPDVRWIFNGDRGITYASTPPQGSEITKGEYWTANYEGKNLVSIEEKLANDLGLNIGDNISVLVLGRRIDAEISNFRKVNWQSFGINFFLVFSPSTFKGAPHTWLMTLSSPTMTFDDEMGLMSDVHGKYPSITAIRVKETLDMIEDLTGKIAVALQALSLLTLLTSLFVLAGALSSSQQARLKEITLLKVLGGKQGLILKLNALNFAFLGVLSVVIALVAGSILAYAISHFALQDTPSLELSSAGVLLLIAIGITLVLGLFGTFQALRTKPSVVLRNL